MHPNAAEFDDEEDDWYEDYMNHYHEKRSIPGAYNVFPKTPPVHRNGTVIDAKNTVGDVPDIRKERGSATSHATSSDFPSVWTGSYPLSNEAKKAYSGTTAVDTTSSTINSSVTHPLSTGETPPHHTHERNSNDNRSRHWMGYGVFSKRAHGQNPDAMQSFTATRGAWPTRYQSGRSNSFQPQTIEAFAVPPDAATRSNIGAVAPNYPLVTAEEMLPDTDASWFRNKRCWWIATAILMAIVGASLVGGYCASGACHRQNPIEDDSTTKSKSSAPPPTPNTSPPIATVAPSLRRPDFSLSTEGSNQTDASSSFSPSLWPTASPQERNTSMPTTTPSSTLAPSITDSALPTYSPTNAASSIEPSPPDMEDDDKDDNVERERVRAIAEHINNITRSGRSLDSTAWKNRTDEGMLSFATPEDLALHWLVALDPLMFWTNATTDRFRLQQRFALLTVWFQQHYYNETMVSTEVTDPWFNSTGWLTRNNECEWHGVTCQNIEHVNESNDTTTVHDPTIKELSLESNNVHGTIPEDVLLLSSLTKFSVFNNSMDGSLPEAIGSWTEMNYFRVSNNSLTGTIPSSILAWDKIYFASFHSNNFTGTVPAFVCGLPNITYLVADCYMTTMCSCCAICYNVTAPV